MNKKNFIFHFEEQLINNNCFEILDYEIEMEKN